MAKIPSSGKGDIFIESDPSEAMVYLDGERKGRTPLELNDVPAGWHTIQLKKGKVYKAEFEINLEADDYIKRKVKLERAKGKIKITSEPSGASIYIDGKDTEMKTPDVITTQAGEHELKLTADGKEYEGTITVDPEQRVVEHITDFKDSGIAGMVLIAGGCFQMGDTFGDGDDDEKPVHEVCVDDFYMGEHEVTQGEWKEIMGNNPSGFISCGGDCPVEQVSWDDVQEYIRKLNKKKDQKYRLPTEAEWEYAAREGGKKVRFGTGKDTIGPDEANFDATEKYKKSYSRSGIYRKKTIPVKSFSPNELGLYDMSGNVWEWVQDWYGKDYYGKSPRNNPKGSDSGEYRILRGGSWGDSPSNLRAVFRGGNRPSGRNNNFGFRLSAPVR